MFPLKLFGVQESCSERDSISCPWLDDTESLKLRAKKERIILLTSYSFSRSLRACFLKTLPRAFLLNQINAR